MKGTVEIEKRNINYLVMSIVWAFCFFIEQVYLYPLSLSFKSAYIVGFFGGIFSFLSLINLIKFLTETETVEKTIKIRHKEERKK